MSKQGSLSSNNVIYKQEHLLEDNRVRSEVRMFVLFRNLAVRRTTRLGALMYDDHTWSSYEDVFVKTSELSGPLPWYRKFG